MTDDKSGMSTFPKGAVLVFGGSGGCGQGVAQCFGAAGADVAIAYRAKRDVAERVAGDFAALGRKMTTHATDVTDATKVKATVAANGRIHTVAWAAGPVVEQVTLGETGEALWKRSIDFEMHGFYHAVQATLPHLREQGGGSYVHLGSAGHAWFPPRDGLSVVPKAATEAFIKGIAKEEGRHDIRANSVLVGVSEAGMFLELSKRGVFDQKWIAEAHKLLCLKRWGRPEDIGKAASLPGHGELRHRPAYQRLRRFRRLSVCHPDA